MSEHQPGQGNSPEASAPASMYPQEFYNTAGAVLSGTAQADTVDVLPGHVDVVQAGLSGLSKTELATARQIFAPPEAKSVVTPASTYKVTEQVVHGPTTPETIGESTKLSPKIVTETLKHLEEKGVIKRDTWGLHITDPRLIMEHAEGTVLEAVTRAATEMLAESGRSDTYATKTEIVDRAIAINPEIWDPNSPNSRHNVWTAYTKEYREGNRSRLTGVTPTPGSGARMPNAVMLADTHRSTVEKVVRKLDVVRTESVTELGVAPPLPPQELHRNVDFIAPESKSENVAPLVGAAAMILDDDPRVRAVAHSLEKMNDSLESVTAAEKAVEQARLLVSELVKSLAEAKTRDPSNFNMNIAAAEHAEANIAAFSLSATKQALEAVRAKL